MSTPSAINRRQLFATIGGGAALGAIWGAAFPVVAGEQRPTVAVVGAADGQIALIDSGSARALVFIGEPSAVLLEQVPAMMTLFRQRIDLIVGTEAILHAHASELASRWQMRHALAIVGNIGEVSLSVPSTSVRAGVDVSLASETRLSIRVGHRNEWLASMPPRPSPLWAASLSTPSATIAFAPDTASIAAAPPGPASLLVAPHAPSPALRAVARFGAMAVNHDSESIKTPEDIDTPLTRIYPRDIARFILSDDGVELPEWTVPIVGPDEN